MITPQKFFHLTFAITTLSSLSIKTEAAYASPKAYVRTSSDLCPQEKDFLIQRLPRIKDSLQTALNMQLNDNQVPRIALCASGGGFRAMVATLGWLQGDAVQVKGTQSTNNKKSLRGLSEYLLATLSSWFGWEANEFTPNTLPLESEPLNLRDLCTHFSSLSGSTWALAGLTYSHMTPAHYLAHITPKIAQGKFDNLNMEDLVVEILKKERSGQPVSFIDIYGIIIAQKLLADLGDGQPSSIDLDTYSTAALAMQNPLPIQTSVIGNDDSNYHWVEFTPYEVGCSYLEAFVPTWAYGRTFNAGISTNFAPAQSLGFCMGTWGSAMAIDMKDFFNLVIDPELGTINASNLEAKFGSLTASGATLLTKIEQEAHKRNANIKADPLLDKRISPAQVFNWVHSLKNTPLHTDKLLTLIDGGIDCNLPVQPLLRPERAVDIIIILDASAGIFGSELHNAQAHAQKWGYPFPAIDYTTINQPCSVHWDRSNAQAPIVIYMPLIKNSNYNNGWDPYGADFTSTYNFTYSVQQTALLGGLTSYNMAQSMPLILDTITQWIATKNS